MKIFKADNYLYVKLNWVEKFLSLHGDFKILEGNVVSISEGKPESGFFDLRFPGTYFPGLIKAGTYYTRRGREFWYVVRGNKYIYTIELRDQNYIRLVLSSAGTIGK